MSGKAPKYISFTGEYSHAFSAFTCKEFTQIRTWFQVGADQGCRGGLGHFKGTMISIFMTIAKATLFASMVQT